MVFSLLIFRSLYISFFFPLLVGAVYSRFTVFASLFVGTGVHVCVGGAAVGVLHGRHLTGHHSQQEVPGGEAPGKDQLWHPQLRQPRLLS